MNPGNVKEYERPVLEIICGGDIAGALPWHELRTDRLGREGLWVRLDHGMSHERERDVVEWNPHGDVAVAALPIPFTARQLAAFMYDGGGWFLRNNDVEAFSNSASAVEVYTEAERLCEQTEKEFGASDAGKRQSVAWLLAQEERSTQSVPPSREAAPAPASGPVRNEGPASETPQERRRRRLKALRDLGGDIRPAGPGWQTIGKRGALAALVKAELAAGRPMSDKTDVRNDLIKALEEQRGS